MQAKYVTWCDQFEFQVGRVEWSSDIHIEHFYTTGLGKYADKYVYKQASHLSNILGYGTAKVEEISVEWRNKLQRKVYIYMERREEQNKRDIVGVDLVKLRSWQDSSFVLSSLSSQLRKGKFLFYCQWIASYDYMFLCIHTVLPRGNYK